MSDLAQQFQDAIASSKSLPRRPDNATMLKLYGLYKQGTDGDAPDAGGGDMVARFKHQAWAGNRGQAREAAMQQYIALVASLHDAMD
jgi:acyl-CoA-binding protein